MNSQPVHVGKLLFQEELDLTDIREYGFRWEDFLNKKRPIPKSGVRFDIMFRGTINSEFVKGAIEGVDEMEVRADGRLFLNLKGTFTTHDGAEILVMVTGTNDEGYLRLAMTFDTSDERYDWLNQGQVWGIGTVDFHERKASIAGYQFISAREK